MVTFREKAIEASLHGDLDAEVRSGGLSLIKWSIILLGAVLLVALIPFEQVIVVPGSICVAGSPALIRSHSGGVVKAVLVKEGDQVAEGSPLIQISTPELDAAIEKARQDEARALHTGRPADDLAEIEAAARLREQQAQLPLVEARIRRANDRLASQRVLAKEGLVPRQAVGLTEDEVDQAQSDRARVLQGISSAKADLAELTRKATESGAPETAARRALQRQQDGMTVKAENAGCVEWIGVNPGDAVVAGQRLIRVAPKGAQQALELVVLLPVDRMGSLHQGLAARVAVNGYEVSEYGYGSAILAQVGRDALTPDQTREIAPANTIDGVFARGMLTPRDWARLKPEPGMTVRAWVVLGRRSLLSRLFAKLD